MKIKLLLVSIFIIIVIFVTSTIAVTYEDPISNPLTWNQQGEKFLEPSTVCRDTGGVLTFDGFFRTSCNGITEKECMDVFNGKYEQCNTRKYTAEEIQFLGEECPESSCIFLP